MERIVRCKWGSILHDPKYGQEYEQKFALILGVYRDIWSRLIEHESEPLFLSETYSIDPVKESTGGLERMIHQRRSCTKQNQYLAFRYPENSGYLFNRLSNICSFPLLFGGYALLVWGAEPRFVKKQENVSSDAFYISFTTYLEQEILRALDAGSHPSGKKMDLRIGWQEVTDYFEQGSRPLTFLELMRCFDGKVLPSPIPAPLPELARAIMDRRSLLESRYANLHAMNFSEIQTLSKDLLAFESLVNDGSGTRLHQSILRKFCSMESCFSGILAAPKQTRFFLCLL